MPVDPDALTRAAGGQAIAPPAPAPVPDDVRQVQCHACRAWTPVRHRIDGEDVVALYCAAHAEQWARYQNLMLPEDLDPRPAALRHAPAAVPLQRLEACRDALDERLDLLPPDGPPPAYPPNPDARNRWATFSPRPEGAWIHHAHA